MTFSQGRRCLMVTYSRSQQARAHMTNIHWSPQMESHGYLLEGSELAGTEDDLYMMSLMVASLRGQQGRAFRASSSKDHPRNFTVTFTRDLQGRAESVRQLQHA
jgi:hypothetical protein